MATLTVFGAGGPTGRQFVRQALAVGYSVVAITRNPAAFPRPLSRLRVVPADVFDAQAVDRAVTGADAVISTFGVPFSLGEVRVYSHGIANIIAAMRHRGIARLVCVSSTGVSTRSVPGETLFWRLAVLPVFRQLIGRTLYADMRRMEDIVRASGVDWTILRPAALFDTDVPTSDFRVGEGRLTGRLTSRADLAQTLLHAAEGRYSRRLIEVISDSQLPTNLQFLRSTFGRSATR